MSWYFQKGAIHCLVEVLLLLVELRRLVCFEAASGLLFCGCFGWRGTGEFSTTLRGGGRRAFGKDEDFVVSVGFSFLIVQEFNVLFYFVLLEGCYRITWFSLFLVVILW